MKSYQCITADVACFRFVPIVRLSRPNGEYIVCVVPVCIRKNDKDDTIRYYSLLFRIMRSTFEQKHSILLWGIQLRVINLT